MTQRIVQMAMRDLRTLLTGCCAAMTRTCMAIRRVTACPRARTRSQPAAARGKRTGQNGQTGERIEGDAVIAVDDFGRPDVDVALTETSRMPVAAPGPISSGKTSRWCKGRLIRGSGTTGSIEGRFHGGDHREAASANQAPLRSNDARVVPEDILRLDSDERVPGMLSRHGRTTLFTGDFWNARHISTTSDSNGRVSVVARVAPRGVVLFTPVSLTPARKPHARSGKCSCKCTAGFPGRVAFPRPNKQDRALSGLEPRHGGQ